MTETRVEPEELRKVAKAIGSIMDDYDSVFRNLGTMDPNAGKFDVAEWLEDLFVDRRDAIVTHAKYLGLAFEEINAGLYKIADAFEGVDMSNADAVAAATGVARSAVEDMADAEFTPTEVKAKDDYDTGDDEDLGDEKTYSIEDGKPKIEFDPDDIHDMEDELEIDGLGPDEDEEIDLGDGETIEDIEDEGAVLHDDDDDDDDDDDRQEDDRQEDDDDGDGDDDDGDDDTPRLPTGEHFTMSEPDENFYPKGGEKDWSDNTWRWYKVDGEHQTGPDGQEIWWLNNQPYFWGPDPSGRNGETDEDFYRYYPPD
ncbi:hypothetical protein [Micromonospora sp. LOL_023]|uniref:hypothetical protein n=1 Tax=Micromonospora sp. LOL_023 TaxID=3345418 RepID=UPI003A84851C